MRLVTSLVALAAAAAVAAGPPPSEQEDSQRIWLTTLPGNITFVCHGRIPGYYADVASGCQMYHMCDPQSRLYSYLCPAFTEFSQFYMTCVQHDRVNCSMSEKFFHMNEMIGKPRMRFHNNRQHDNSKKKDTEGSKADNRVETSEPVGHVLFEFETKVDMPLRKSLRSRTRARPRGTSAGQTAGSGRPRLAAASSTGRGGSRRDGSPPAKWRHLSPVAPRGKPASARQAPQNRARDASEAQVAASVTAAPLGSRTVASSAGRASSAAAPPPTAVLSTPLTTPAAPRAGGTTPAATERAVTTAGRAPRPRLTTQASTAPPTTEGTTAPADRTGPRGTTTGRVRATGGDLNGFFTTTPRPRARASPANRPSSRGAQLNKTTDTARRMKPRVRFSDINRNAVTTTKRPTVRTIPAPIAAPEGPALPKNTYRTFGLPGSFAFGTLLNLGNNVTPLPVRTHATTTTTGETTARATTAPPTSVRSTIAPPTRFKWTTASPTTASSRSTAKTSGGAQDATTTAKSARIRPRGRSTTARTTKALKAASSPRTNVRSTTVKTTESTTKPTTVEATTAKSSTSQATTPKPLKSHSTTRRPSTKRRTTARRTTSKSTTAKPTTAKPTTAKQTTTKSTATKPTTATPTTTKPTTSKRTTTRPTTTRPTTIRPTTNKLTTTKQTTTKQTTSRSNTRPRSRSRPQQIVSKTSPPTTESSPVIPEPSAGTPRTTPPARSLSFHRTSNEPPPDDELEALHLSFTIEPPSLTVKADGPHEERNMKVRGELITGEMALRKLMVEQLNPVYFPNPSVPLNLLPPLLSEQEASDGRQTTTLTLPVRRRQPNSLFQAAAVAFDLLPPELASLVPPLLTTPAPPGVQTPTPSTERSPAPPAAEAPATSLPSTPSRPTAKPRKDPASLTMKFGKKKKQFRVGDAHGSKDDACYPCMKSFIKDLDSCHPCVVIR